MLLRRSALQTVGWFDPDYFVWYEDVDWSYRARQKGFKLLALPAVKVVHWGGASFTNWSADQFKWQFVRSFLRFLSKHRQNGLLRWSCAILSVDVVLKGLMFPLLRRLGTTGLRNYSTALPKALRHTMRDIMTAHRRGELVSFSWKDASPPGL